MRIAVTGSTGLIGSALVSALRAGGHSVSRIVRYTPPAGQSERLISWNPGRGVIDAGALENHDAVVHLAGENLAGLWTQARKARIRESRLRGTNLLARTLVGLSHPPAVFISASAIGFYGDRSPSEGLAEDGSAGSGFLAGLVVEWEAAALQAEAAGLRVACTRFGIVLSPRGGALRPLMLAVKLGVGGRFGSGKQVWSWIALDDVVGAIIHVIDHSELTGPVNLVAPNPVSNEELVRTLGRVLHRPTFLHAPAFAMRAIGGQMAEEALLSGVRVVPRKLLDSGYAWRYPDLEGALRAMM